MLSHPPHLVRWDVIWRDAKESGQKILSAISWESSGWVAAVGGHRLPGGMSGSQCRLEPAAKWQSLAGKPECQFWQRDGRRQQDADGHRNELRGRIGHGQQRLDFEPSIFLSPPQAFPLPSARDKAPRSALSSRPTQLGPSMPRLQSTATHRILSPIFALRNGSRERAAHAQSNQ